MAGTVWRLRFIVDLAGVPADFWVTFAAAPPFAKFNGERYARVDLDDTTHTATYKKAP